MPFISGTSNSNPYERQFRRRLFPESSSSSEDASYSLDTYSTSADDSLSDHAMSEEEDVRAPFDMQHTLPNMAASGQNPLSGERFNRIHTEESLWSICGGDSGNAAMPVPADDDEMGQRLADTSAQQAPWTPWSSQFNVAPSLWS